MVYVKNVVGGIVRLGVLFTGSPSAEKRGGFGENSFLTDTYVLGGIKCILVEVGNILVYLLQGLSFYYSFYNVGFHYRSHTFHYSCSISFFLQHVDKRGRFIIGIYAAN